MLKNYKKGFTLIELLVVIAIIGILSSVVLASLNSARGKGANAAVKSNLNNIRAQAEIFYDDNGSSYTAGITCTTGLFSDTNVQQGAAQAIAQGGTGTAVCGSTASGWAVAVPLKVAEGSNTFWCVDSSGQSRGTVGATIVASTDLVCG